VLDRAADPLARHAVVSRNNALSYEEIRRARGKLEAEQERTRYVHGSYVVVVHVMYPFTTLTRTTTITTTEGRRRISLTSSSCLKISGRR